MMVGDNNKEKPSDLINSFIKTALYANVANDNKENPNNLINSFIKTALYVDAVNRVLKISEVVAKHFNVSIMLLHGKKANNKAFDAKSVSIYLVDKHNLLLQDDICLLFTIERRQMLYCVKYIKNLNPQIKIENDIIEKIKIIEQEI